MCREPLTPLLHSAAEAGTCVGKLLSSYSSPLSYVIEAGICVGKFLLLPYPLLQELEHV